MNSYLKLPGYSLEHPPTFTNDMVTLASTNDRIVFYHSIPILFSIAEHWPLGGTFHRVEVVEELPYMQAFAQSTRILYTTAVINWALKAHRRNRDLLLGVELPDRRYKYMYKRGSAATLINMIERNAQTSYEMERQKKEKEHLKKLKYEADENPLAEHGIGPSGLGLDTGSPEPTPAETMPVERYNTEDLKQQNLEKVPEVEIDGQPVKIQK